MKRKEFIIVFFIFFSILIVFFYKTFFHGLIPFPGDLLVSEYNPWKSYSYLGYNPGSFPNKAQYFDVIRQIYPWKTLSVELIKNAVLPLWNPYNFSGGPLLANFQSAVFYPFGIFYLFFTQKIAMTILIMLQPFLAMIFTYLYTRKIGVSSMGSLFAAASFGLSAFSAVWLEYNTIGQVVLWLPLSLLAAEHILAGKSLRWMIIFVLSLVFALFAGHPQIFAYSLFFSSSYIIYRVFISTKPNEDRLRKLFHFSFLILLSVGISSVQLVPGIELVRESARVSHDYTFLMQKILIQPAQLIMMIVPDFFGNPATRNYWLSDTYIGKVTYVGLIPLFFVVLSLRHFRKNYITFFSVAALIVLLFTTNNPFSSLLYKFPIPLVSTSAPTLSVFLLCFCMSILAGFGVDIYRKEEKFRKVLVWMLALPIIILLLWVIVFLVPQAISSNLSGNLRIVYRNLFYASALAGAGIVLLGIGLLRKKYVLLVLLALFVIQTGDLLRYFVKFNPFVPSALVFPSAPVFEHLQKEAGINRFWGYGAGAVEANFATHYSLFSPDGYDPLYPKKYGEFIQSSANGKIVEQFTTRTRSDAFIAPGSGETDLASNRQRLQVLNMLGVKYILDRAENASTEKTFPKEHFSPIYNQDGWKIFENTKAAPRVFLTTDYKTFTTNKEFETLFFSPDFVSSRTVLLEQEPGKKPDARAKGTLELVSYSPNKVALNSRADGPMLLFMSDTYYPGWKAYVNGKEQKIYRANYAFRAISVPKGDSVVSFTFAPMSFKIGLLTTATSSMVFVLYLFYNQRKRQIRE